MSSPSSFINKHALGKVFLQTSLFLLILNGISYSYLQYYNPNKAYALIQKKWKLLQEYPAVDWLIIGDSAGNQGVDPTLFERAKNSSALNLCTIADLLLLNEVWQVETLIQNGKAPKNILLIHTYDIWQRGAIPTGYASQIPSIPADYPLANYALSPIKKQLMNAMPINFQRASLGHILQHPHTWFQRNYQWEEDGFERIEKADTEEVLRDTEAHLAFVKNNDFKISQANETALTALAQSAKENGIQIFFAHAPYYEGLYQNEDFRTYFQQAEQYLQTFCKKNNWAYLADIQTFKAEEMENADHITAATAETFTEGILQQLP
ncbi:MAG: hypothetical protein AB8G22_03110 [Saprospiraceae bacterium]